MLFFQVLFQLATRGPLANTDYKLPIKVEVLQNAQLDLPDTTIIEGGDVPFSIALTTL